MPYHTKKLKDLASVVVKQHKLSNNIPKFTTLPVQVQVPAVVVLPVQVDETKPAV